MCLIVDANRAHVLFGQPGSDVAAAVWKWLRKDGILIYGGQLAAELGRTAGALRLLAELRRSGRAVKESDVDIAREEERIKASGECASNDQHVIALACVSGARVLYTEDKTLMKDFVNTRLLRPKGKIYRRAQQRRLLAHARGCRANR